MKFSELKRKEVINVCDGRRMGYVCDIIFNGATCCIEAIVIPGPFHISTLFSRYRNRVIPWCKIRKLGDDVILVDAEDIRPCSN